MLDLSVCMSKKFLRFFNYSVHVSWCLVGGMGADGKRKFDDSEEEDKIQLEKPPPPPQSPEKCRKVSDDDSMNGMKLSCVCSSPSRSCCGKAVAHAVAA